MDQEKFFYRQGILQSEAVAAVEEYRQKYGSSLGTHGVLYTKQEMDTYFKDFFDPFVKAPENKPPTGFEWGIGHYFMINNGRLSFCVVPTLYNQNEVKDRYEKKELQIKPLHYDNDAHVSITSIKAEDPPGNGEAFDKGGMWP